MEALRKYFEDNPDLFAAFVAALAILGGLAGSVIGAKIQAAGGRAQADAARQAAEISSEAQRVAALWTVRQAQTAEFIQRVREVVRLSDLLYRRDSYSGLATEVHEAHQALTQKRAEIELIAPSSVVTRAEEVVSSVEDVTELAFARGQGEYAKLVIARLIFSDDQEESALARLAHDALAELRRAHAAGDLSARNRAHSVAVQALGAVPGLARAHVASALLHAGDPDVAPSKEEAVRDLGQKLATLVEAARAMLKSEDPNPSRSITVDHRP